MKTIAANIISICQDIQELSNKYRQPPAKLVAVSKTYPAEAIKIAHTRGQRRFGENYAHELAKKALLLNNIVDLEWHYIGTIQSNKTKLIAENALWVHTLTKLAHAKRLDQQRPTHLPPLQVLIEVNISGGKSKHGLTNFTEIIELAKSIDNLQNLNLRGLMGMASAKANYQQVHREFTQLKHYLVELNKHGFGLDQLSMGMSQDYPAAIECGSTIIRVGSKIFGERNYAK